MCTEKCDVRSGWALTIGTQQGEAQPRGLLTLRPLLRRPRVLGQARCLLGPGLSIDRPNPPPTASAGWARGTAGLLSNASSSPTLS